MHEVPILAAILSCAVPLAVLVVAFKRPLVAVWNGPLARCLRAAHWTVRAAALVAFAFLTAYGGGKGGDTNTLVSTSGEANSTAMLGGLISIPAWYLYDPTDTDQDGIPDLWEIWTHGDPLVRDSDLDRDGDGLTDFEEFWNQTDPRTADTDGDGLSDYLEALYGLDPLVPEDYEGVVEPDANSNNVPDYWEDSSFEWFTDSNQDGFHDYFTLPEGTPVGGAVTVTLTTTRTAAFSWSGDGFSGGILFGPCTNRTFKFRVPAECDTALSLQPPTVDSTSAGVWKARMRVAWDPGNVRPYEGVRLALEDGPVLHLDPLVEGTRTYLAPASGFARMSSTSTDSPQTNVRRHSISLAKEGNWCVIHGGDVFVTATYANTFPPFRWWLCDDENNWSLTGQTGTVFSASSLSVGTYTVKCSEYDLGNASFSAWAEIDVGVYRCQPVETNYWGAINHLPDHIPETVTIPSAYPEPCEPLRAVLYYIGFDHDKVNTRNLPLIPTGDPASDYTDHCLGVLWSENGSVDLFSLLEPNYQVCSSELYFRIDGEQVEGSVLEYGWPPTDLNPTIHYIELRHAEEDAVLDRLWYVINSSGSSDRFHNWHADNSDLSWTTSLPPAYEVIGFGGGDPEPEYPDFWSAPVTISTFYHHNAQHEMRSVPFGAHGHQATYTNGILVVSGITAGTADYRSPEYSLSGHKYEDVHPYVRALQLDGNPVWSIPLNFVPINLFRPCLYEGPHASMYIQRRPILPTGTVRP